MLWKKAVLLSLIGFAAGVLIGLAFGLRNGTGFWDSLPHRLVGGVYGAVAMGSSIVYDVEKWSVARATATHFLLVFSLYFLVVITMGWFRLDDPFFWIFIAVMVFAYVLIWLFQYLVYRRKIRKMNNDLNRIKSGISEK